MEDWESYFVSRVGFYIHNNSASIVFIVNGKKKSLYIILHLKDSKYMGEKRNLHHHIKMIIQENINRDRGKMKSDSSEKILIQARQSKKGVTPSELEVHIDHMKLRSKRGSNSPSNA